MHCCQRFVGHSCHNGRRALAGDLYVYLVNSGRLCARMSVCALLVAVALPRIGMADAHEGHYRELLNDRFACGRNALWLLVKLTGGQVPESEFLRQINRPEDSHGFSLLKLRDAAELVGCPCVVRRLSIEDLKSTTFPIVAHLRASNVDSGVGHFIVMVAYDRKAPWCIDPTTGEYAPYAHDTFEELWTGYILQPQSAVFRPGVGPVDRLLTFSMLLLFAGTLVAMTAPTRRNL